MIPGRRESVAGICVLLLAACAGAPPLKSSVDVPLTASTQAVTPAQAQVIKVAQSLLGAPYRYGGVTPSGFDCSGFIFYVYRQAAGVELPRETQGLIQIGRPIELADLRPADIVYFTIDGRRALHTGIYVGNGLFIHAPSSKGQVNIQDLHSDYWKARYQGARRVLWRSGL